MPYSALEKFITRAGILGKNVAAFKSAVVATVAAGNLATLRVGAGSPAARQPAIADLNTGTATTAQIATALNSWLAAARLFGFIAP